MRVALFGSPFNPPHLGHALVIQNFLEAKLCDELWLLPNVKPSFGKETAPNKHRIEMTKLFHQFLTQTNPGIKDPGIEPGKSSNQSYNKSTIRVCNIEMDLDLSGQTYDTLTALKTHPEYLEQKMQIPLYSIPDTSYSFLMGSDQLPHFHLWGNYQQMLQEMKFYVYPRVGYPNEPLMEGMELFNTPTQTITNISSTLIRHRILNHQSCSLLLPPSIVEYINRQQLYCNQQ